MTGPLREKYEREYAERLAKPAGKDRGEPICQVALERSLAAIASTGARPMLLVPPTTNARNFFPAPEREPQLAILDFTDVRQYPELFVPEHRMDVGHLNTVGAEIFTEILARRFVELAQSEASCRRSVPLRFGVFLFAIYSGSARRSSERAPRLPYR